MEKDLISRVETVKERCKKIDELLHERYNALDMLGSSNETLNELVDYMNRNRAIYEEANLNITRAENKINRLTTELVDKYDLFESAKQEIPNEVQKRNLSEEIQALKKRRNYAIIQTIIYGACAGVWVANTYVHGTGLSATCASLFGVNTGLSLSEALKSGSELEELKKEDRSITLKK